MKTRKKPNRGNFLMEELLITLLFVSTLLIYFDAPKKLKKIIMARHSQILENVRQPHL